MRRRCLVAILLLSGCIDLSTDPDEIAAIEFSKLPWPSIVAGDTLRDESGAASPLMARLFDGEGDIVEGAVEFVAQSPLVRVVEGNLLVADPTATGPVLIIASTTGVQSIPVTIQVVPRPDSMALDGPVNPLQWVVPDDPALNLSDPIRAKILTHTSEIPAPVSSWVVRYQLQAGDRIIPENDTTQIWLVGENGRPSYADTTDATGAASRRVRLRVAPGLTPPDSAIITMTASYNGLPVLGSPIVVILPLVPR